MRFWNLILYFCLAIQTYKCQETTTETAQSSTEFLLRISPKIVGGMAVTDRTVYAYQASLRYYGSHFCGGSIINKRHVLSAAHCCFIDGNLMNPSTLTVVVGDLYVDVISSNTVFRSVLELLVHEAYDASTITNDIALIRISDPFPEWSPTISPVLLADTALPVDSICVVSGWGYTVEVSTTVSSSLQTVAVRTIDTSQCNATYGGLIAPGMLCAGDMAGGKDACQGDSGGPLVCGLHDDSLPTLLAGVVSWGHGCAREGYPGVYSEVAWYKSWIEERIGDDDGGGGGVDAEERGGDLDLEVDGNGSESIFCCGKALVVVFVVVFNLLP